MKKKSNQNKNRKELYGNTKNGGELLSGIKLSIIVVLVLGLVYFFTALATGEIKLGNNEKKEEEAIIQYEEIIGGQVLNRPSKEYYVILFGFTNNNASRFVGLKDSYLKKEKALPVYLVDLDKDFNKGILALKDEKYPAKPSKIEDLKISDTTILKVKNKKVVERIEKDEAVKKYLEKLAED